MVGKHEYCDKDVSSPSQRAGLYLFSKHRWGLGWKLMADCQVHWKSKDMNIGMEEKIKKSDEK